MATKKKKVQVSLAAKASGYGGVAAGSLAATAVQRTWGPKLKLGPKGSALAVMGLGVALNELPDFMDLGSEELRQLTKGSGLGMFATAVPTLTVAIAPPALSQKLGLTAGLAGLSGDDDYIVSGIEDHPGTVNGHDDLLHGAATVNGTAAATTF